MSRPRLLDLFCGHGGAAMGYHRAGFDVFGVDIRPWDFYPFDQVQGDALEYLAEHGHEFDAIHASPPCQVYSSVGNSGIYDRADYDDLLAPTVAALEAQTRPWIVENVPNAPGAFGILLCGSMFDGIKYKRHRYFAGGNWDFPIMAPAGCNHSILDKGSIYANWGREIDPVYRVATRKYLDGLGMTWVPDDPTRKESGGFIEGIPPAYTEWIGAQLLRALESAA